MNIVITHNTIDPYKPIQGGTVRYFLNLIVNLEKSKVESLVLGVKLGRVEDCGKSLKNVRVNYILNKDTSWLKYFLLLFLKAPFLSIKRDSIIISASIFNLIPFIIFYPKTKKIFISDEPLFYARSRYSSIFWVIKPVYYYLERICVKRVTYLLSNSKTISNYKNRLGNITNYVSMSTSGIDSNLFYRRTEDEISRAKKKYNLSEGYIVMFVGRLARVKNIPFLLRALKLAQKYSKDIRFVLVGDGEEREDLLRYNADIDAKAEFVGEIKPDDIPLLLNCADVSVLGSLTEGSPTVVRESISCGVPVVSLDVGDCDEVMGGNRYLGSIVVGNEQAFADKILEYITMDKKIILAECAKKSNELSYSCIFVKLHNLLMELSPK